MTRIVLHNLIATSIDSKFQTITSLSFHQQVDIHEKLQPMIEIIIDNEP